MSGSGPIRRGFAATERDVEPAPPPRPLLIPAVALIVGIALADRVGAVSASARGAVLLAPLAPAALLVVLVWRGVSNRRVLYSVLALAALAVGFARHQGVLAVSSNHISRGLTEEPVLTRLAGRVITPPIERPGDRRNPFIPFEPPPRTDFVVAVDELRTNEPPARVTGKVRVSVEATGLGLTLGQRVQLTGKLYRPRGPRNPGELDWAGWYHRQGLAAGMTVESGVHVLPLPDTPPRWPRFVAWLRTRATALLLEPQASYATEDAARLLEVLVLGQRGAADRALNEAFLRAGALHFLAVSGFHVGALAAAAWWLVRHILRRGRRTAAAMTLVATLWYAIIAEPNAPILRAAVGVALLALALMMGRPVCTLNWLSAAAIVLLLADPHELFRAGFQLSFVQVLGLLTVVPAVWSRWIVRRRDDDPPREAVSLRGIALQRLACAAAGLAVVCLCAWVVSLPLTAYHFGRFAPWGWLGSLVLTPLVTATIILSFLSIAAGAIWAPLGAMPAPLVHHVTAVLLRTVGWFEPVPAAVIEHPPPPLWLVAASYAGLLIWVVRRPASTDSSPRERSAWLRTVVAANVLGAILLAWIGWLVLPAGGRGAGYTLHVLAVGNGAAAIWTTPPGQAAVFDVGTDTNTDVGETVARALTALGPRRIDAAVISHSNYDHYSGLPTLAAQRRVRRWFAGERFDVEKLNAAGSDCVQGAPSPEFSSARLGIPERLHAGERLTVGESVIEVLWPPSGLDAGWSVNDTSLVLRVAVAGRSILLPGDIERPAITALLDAERAGRLSLKADVLVAPHHGSVVTNVTADFLAAVSPSIIVVSTRTPRPRFVALVRDVLGPATRVVLTGEAGAATVRITPAGEIRLETPFVSASSLRERARDR